MTVASDILGPQGIGRILDVTIGELWLGVRRFWRGGEYANAPAGQSIALLNRMMRVLRFVFLILATHVKLAPARPRTGGGKRARCVRMREPVFRIFPRYRLRYDDTPKHAQPKAFAGPHDRFLIARRKLDALTRALSSPMPFIRRMARRLPAQLMVIGWRPPKRPPPTHRRAFWDELIESYQEAWFHLHAYWRRTRESREEASGSDGSGEPKACADD